MGGEDGGDVIVGGTRQMRCGSEMASLAIVQRERLVGDPAQDVLQKGELVALRGKRVELPRQNLLAQQRLEVRIQFVVATAGDRSEPGARERAAEHRCIFEQPTLLRFKS